MNFGFSGEMIFLFFLALILFGPKKLPEIGRTIGRFMSEFRRASNEFRSQIEAEINAADIKQSILPPGRAPLESIASRILNSHTAEVKEAIESAVDSARAPEPPPAPKAAPDA